MSVMGIGPGRLFGPISDVTGFSERDGLTHLEIQRRMREKLLELIAAYNTLANNQRVINANIATNSDFVNSLVEGRLGPVIMDGVNGVVADGITDNTVAVQAIIDSAPKGSTIHLIPTGNPVLIEGTITVDTESLTFTSWSSDGYGTYFKRTAPGTMFLVRSSGARFSSVHFEGNGSDFGADATCSAIDFYGTPAGNVDGYVEDCVFYHMNRCVEIHGRNVIVDRNLFSNSRQAVIQGGPVSGYHATDGWFTRGLRVNNNRMHGMGVDGDKIVHVTADSVLYHGAIENNYFDINSYGNPIYIEGSNVFKTSYVSIKENKIQNVMRDAITLNYVTHCVLSDNEISAGSHMLSTALGLNIINSTDVAVNDLTVNQMRNDGIKIRSSSQIRFNGCVLRGIAGNGVNLDATDQLCYFNNVMMRDITLDGFTGDGDPNCKIQNCSIDVTGNEISSPRLRNLSATKSIVASTGWNILAGAPSNLNINSVPALAFDSATTEHVSKIIQIPEDWYSFDVDILCCGATEGNGNVLWGSSIAPLNEGDSPLLVNTTGAVTVITGTNIVRTRLLSNVLNNESGVNNFRIYRDGSNISDTYGSDVAMLAVIFTRRQN